MRHSLKLLSLITLSVSFLLTSCGKEINPNYAEEVADPEFYHRSVKQLTDVIVHDIFSPPVAGRIYAYSSIAGYEALAAGSDDLETLAGRITHLAPAPAPNPALNINFEIAAITAQIRAGKHFIFSEDRMTTYFTDLSAEIDKIGVPDDVLANSIAYGIEVAEHVIAWSGSDMYKQTRTFPKYSITRDPAKWQPTPPDYMDGIEPSWAKIRPFLLERPDQFKPAPPTAYDEAEDSEWTAGVNVVYKALKVDDEDELAERIAIAKFWDCNPYVSHHVGHAMFATKKITPGGHWINITAIASRAAGADFATTVEAYAKVAMAMHDGFISCWDEKYRSNLVRPETYIKNFIDEDWNPLLQTPPFPEHTSGHSVVSRACAIVLTDIYGNDLAFADDSEVEYDLPVREYENFLRASEEAALSRLYGGIHYMPAITEGLVQGEKVGKHLIEKLGKTDVISKK